MLATVARAVALGTAASRHHGGPIKGPPETPSTSRQYVGTGGFEGPLNWAPVRPGDVRMWPFIQSDPTQRNIFGILLNQTEIGLYLPFSVSFGTANGQCPFGSKSIGKW